MRHQAEERIPAWKKNIKLMNNYAKQRQECKVFDSPRLKMITVIKSSCDSPVRDQQK